MEAKFTDILEKDEKVINVYKPNKCKFWTVVILTALLCYVWYYAILFGAIPESGKSFDSSLFWMLFGIASALFVVSMLLHILFAALYYKNRFYAYTTKRIVVRGGIIGIDYKSLEFKHLTATTVYVSFIDKILRRNTGSLRFGSPSSPIGGSMHTMNNPYTFQHIVKPYDTLREIKERIDACEKKDAKTGKDKD